VVAPDESGAAPAGAARVGVFAGEAVVVGVAADGVDGDGAAAEGGVLAEGCAVGGWSAVLAEGGGGVTVEFSGPFDGKGEAFGGADWVGWEKVRNPGIPVSWKRI